MGACSNGERVFPRNWYCWVLYNTQCAHIEHSVCAGHALSMGGGYPNKQPHLPSWRSPRKEVLSDISKFSEDRKHLGGVTWQDIGDKTEEGGQGKGRSPRQQSEDVSSGTSSVTDLLCDTRHVLPLSGSHFSLLCNEGICLDL